VVRALEKPHVKGAFHEHKPNRVMIYLQPGTQTFEYKDGRKPETFNWKAGQVVWSPAGGLHSPEVTSNEGFNIVEVELKTKGGKAADVKRDPPKVDPKHYTVEFENDQVRVMRVKVGAHEKVAMHDHGLNRISVFLTDADVKSTSADGKVETAHHKAGEAAWSAGAFSHAEENQSDKGYEVVLVEIKG